MLLAASIIVIVIAQRADDPQRIAFERAARGVLGDEGKIEFVSAPSDPPDADSERRAREATDGVVELSWSKDGSSAHLHCYLRRERRWVDRDISFGSEPSGTQRDAEERGRLLGFATAGMFAEDVSTPQTAEEAPSQPPTTSRLPTAAPEGGSSPALRYGSAASTPLRRNLEFAGLGSTGFGGTASGVGAAAGFRWRWTERFWTRTFVAGRVGSIPVAQATTRSVQLGVGVAFAALASSSTPWRAGARVDGFVNYFEASHLSEDDVKPDVRSRWSPGTDALLEAGFCFTPNIGIFAALGVEVLLGRTEIYTHGNRVAVVPPLRGVGELGFRADF